MIGKIEILCVLIVWFGIDFDVCVVFNFSIWVIVEVYVYYYIFYVFVVDENMVFVFDISNRNLYGGYD